MINNTWKFDEKFLIKTIQDINKILKTDSISFEQREILDDTVLHFSRYLDILNNNYKRPLEDENNDVKFDEMSKKFKNKATKDFNEIGDDIIDIIINLSKEHPFIDFKFDEYHKETLTDEIVDNSLKIYQAFFPSLYLTAEYITECPIKLINFSENEAIGSSCFFEESFGLPFIHIENPDKSPSAFIHELQHGVELIKKYKSNYYLGELGSILLETLYIDDLVNKREVNAPNLYFERICEIEQLLDYLADYFRTLKELRKHNFSITNGKLITILQKNNLIYNDRLELSNILNENFEECLVYLISFFKSLEIRKLMYRDKLYGLKMMKNILLNKQKIDLKEERVLENYESFLAEVNSKVKNYPHLRNKHS